MNRNVKLFLLNLMIVIVAIVCYSSGFLALRPWDLSVLRAGSSLFIGFLCLLGLTYGNYTLLRQAPQNKQLPEKTIRDLSQVDAILDQYKKGKFFGPVATTVKDQLGRFQKAQERARWEVEQKFPKASMSYQRYIAVLEAAKSTVIKDVTVTVNRMRLFDEEEYERLKHYKEDNIPDDIQEKQIEIYRQNLALIEEVIAKNERMILHLDTLSVTISKAEEADDGDTLLEEIRILTDEIKYYT